MPIADDEDDIVDVDDDDDRPVRVVASAADADADEADDDDDDDDDDATNEDAHATVSAAGKAQRSPRRSLRKTAPVNRKLKSPTPRRILLSSSIASPRKRGRPRRITTSALPTDDHASGAVGTPDRVSSDHDNHYNAYAIATANASVASAVPAPVSKKRGRPPLSTAKRTEPPATRRFTRVAAKQIKRAAAPKRRAMIDDQMTRLEDKDLDDDDEDEDNEDDIAINGEDDEDDDVSVKVRNKSMLSSMRAGRGRPPSSKPTSTNTASTKHNDMPPNNDGSDDVLQVSPLAMSSRGTKSNGTTSDAGAKADAIVNRTRSARRSSVEGTDRTTRRSGMPDVGAARAFATRDSGPMASRVAPLPDGVVDSRVYSLDLNEIDMDRRVHLSRGAVSDVYKVRWCGVSAVLKQWHSSSDAERFKNEVDITRLCQFPRVVQLFGASLEHKAMLIERLGRGNLRQVLTSEKYTLASIDRRLRAWALEVAEAMAFVHANGVIHYDLKSQNVLVTMSWHTRLCDFSHSVYVGNDARSAGTAEWGQVGSLEITAPEVFTQRQRTPKSDVYSFGLLLWEMLSYGEMPFLQYSTDARALQTYVCPPVNGRPPLKSTWDPHVKDIMRRSWSNDPSHRPTFVQVIQMLHGLKDVR